MLASLTALPLLHNRMAMVARLSEEQQAALICVREAMCINLGRLQARRENLSRQLQVHRCWRWLMSS